MPNFSTKDKIGIWLLLGTLICNNSISAQDFQHYLKQVNSYDSSSSKPLVRQQGDLYPFAEWSGEPQWLSGHHWGGNTFNGSIDYTVEFYQEVNMGDNEYAPVQIRITPSETTYSQVYRLDNGFAPEGVGVFPGSAWDISDPDNPRRLNLTFLEDGNSPDSTQANLYWDPNTSTDGGYEQLFVMASSYDGTGETYGPGNHALNNDAMYVWWPRLVSGNDFFAADTSELTIWLVEYAIENLTIQPSDGQLHLSWEFSGAGVDSLYLYYSQSQGADQLLQTFSTSDTSFVHTGLTNGEDYYYRFKAFDTSGGVKYVSEEKHGKPQKVKQNMSLLQHWDQRGNYGDIWGYTDPETGEEYALLCARNEGLSIIDISGNQTTEVGFEPAVTPEVDSKDVKVYGHYAILINETAPAQIIDLADPTNPQTVATINIGNTNSGGAHNCYVAGDYLYTIGNHGLGGLIIYDISNPINPEQVGSYEPYYYHDIYVRNDTAYATGIYGEGVDILDVSDKSNVQQLANFNYTGSGAHNVWTSEDGKYAFVGDEVGSSGNWIRVYDISDLDDIEQVSEIIVDPNAITHNCYVKGDYLYIGHYTEGIRIWDISDPTNPTETGFYDTYLQDHYGFSGCWSVYPYFDSGKIIGSDMQSGLYVVRFDSLTTGISPGDAQAPKQFALHQNYPNPFNPVTTIEYSLPEQSRVVLDVYDIRGRKITTLVRATQNAGAHSIRWNASDMPSGVYFYRISAGSFAETKKLVLMK